MSNQLTITEAAATGVLQIQPGATVVLKTRIVGAGTITITDHDGDDLEEHVDLAATQTKTVDVMGALTVTGSDLDETSAHVVTYELLSVR